MTTPLPDMPVVREWVDQTTFPNAKPGKIDLSIVNAMVEEHNALARYVTALQAQLAEQKACARVITDELSAAYIAVTTQRQCAEAAEARAEEMASHARVIIAELERQTHGRDLLNGPWLSEAVKLIRPLLSGLSAAQPKEAGNG